MPWGGQLVTGFADSQRILTERSWRSLDAAHLDATQPGWQRHSSLRGVFSSALQTNPPLHTRLRRQPGNPLGPRKRHSAGADRGTRRPHSAYGDIRGGPGEARSPESGDSGTIGCAEHRRFTGFR